MQNDLLARIKNQYDRFSKGQKLLADYILNNYDKAVFLTAAKLGDIVGVSESTVVRFAAALGFEGYPALNKALEAMVKNRLNSAQRMEVNFDRLNQGNILKSVLHADAEKIRRTMEEIDEEAFNRAVEIILNAGDIYIMGVRSSAPLAGFLYFYIKIIFRQVKLIQSNSGSELFEQLYHIGAEDVIIGISFPRYSSSTLKAVEFARDRKAHIITVTDSYNSPLTAFTNCNLIAGSDLANVVDSLVAPMSVINALVVALYLKKQDKVVDTYASLEEIWREYKVYKD